jgi:hypothetical protein
MPITTRLASWPPKMTDAPSDPALRDAELLQAATALAADEVVASDSWRVGRCSATD